jgi:hypothetical protein
MTCFKSLVASLLLAKKPKLGINIKLGTLLIHALKNSFRINPPVSFIFT